MKIIEMRNKDNEKVLPDFIEQEVSNSKIKVPSSYVVNDLIQKKYNSGVSLVTQHASGITITSCAYAKCGNIITVTVGFHVETEISNGTEMFKVSVPGPLINCYAAVRSASEAIVGGFNLSGSESFLSATAAGNFPAGDWYGFTITYVCV